MNHSSHNEQHAKEREPTTAHFHYTSRSTLTLPIVSLVAIIAACAVGYAWFSRTVEQMDRNTKQLEEMQREWNKTRDIIINVEGTIKLLGEEVKGSAAQRGKEGR